MADENNAAAAATAAAAHSKLSCWFCCYMLTIAAHAAQDLCA
jgi:hypothetical protein